MSVATIGVDHWGERSGHVDGAGGGRSCAKASMHACGSRTTARLLAIPWQ